MTRRTHPTSRRPMAALVILACIAAGLSVLLAAPAQAATVRAFTPVFTANTTGDVMLRGNTLMTCPAGSVTGSTTCASAQAGTSTGSTGTDNNFAMTYVDVDSDPSTFNSSSATVTVPAGATVLYAALTWGANTSAGNTVGTVAGVATPTLANRGVVSLKAPGGSYATVTSSRTDAVGTNSAYQGFADVTPTVAAAGSGSYTVGNVQSGTGGDRYAGWSLAIAYRDTTQPTRNLVVYSGFGTVTGSDSSLEIPVSGFTTPPSGTVVTRLGVVAYEGDKGNVGDGLKLGATQQVSNTLNPVTDVFNSSVTDLGVAIVDRTPAYPNQLGFDIDRLDATGVLPNGATSTTITLNTASPGGETYYPGLITFATQLYGPVLTVAKSATDVNAGTLSPGDVLDYSVAVTNSSGDATTSTVLTDAVPTGTTYVANSLKVDGVARTDAAGDDVGDVAAGTVTARLGTGATSSAGGALLIDATTIVSFRVKVGSAAIDGTEVSNAASVTARGLTTGDVLTKQSNTVISTVTVLPVLTFTASMPAAQVGTAYTNQLTRTGGTGPYVWSLSVGTLPTGLTLDSATGLLSGMPTSAGSSSFTVKIVDANGQSTTKAATLVVAKAASTVALTRSAPTTPFGTDVTLTADVVPTAATGSVTFTDVPSSGPQAGTTVTLGTAPVSAGTAGLTLPMPAFGLNTVKATYSGDVNNTTATSTTVTVEVTAYAGEVIVTELRGSGPGGADDSYVELLNTGPAAPMAGFRVQSDSGTTTTLPSNAGTLGTGRSYLVTGSGYSLGAVAASDRPVTTLGTGGMRVLAPDTAGTRTDAVGPSSGYHLGTGLPAMAGAPTAQHAWVRDETAGRGRNTNDNAADFRLVSATGGVVGGLQSTLGGASPTGSTNPYQHNAALQSTLLDTGVGQAAAPNRSYTVGAPGVLTLRRTVTNTSGRTITAAKLRVTALSEANGAPRPGGGAPPPRQANLRVVDPGTATSQVTVSGGGTVTVQNVSVDAPATTGGGLNSTLTVPLGGGLAPGAAVNVAVTFAVDTRGTFWFGYDIDATDTAAPVGLGRRLSGLSSPPRPGRSAVPAAGGTVRGDLR